MSLHATDYKAAFDKVRTWAVDTATAHPQATVITVLLVLAFFAGYALG